jgi:hypothetical protein
MGLIEIIFMVTGPGWLIEKIGLVAILLSGVVLVYFGSFVHSRVVLVVADWIKNVTRNKMGKIKRVSKFSNFIACSIATIFFLFYVYFGGYILAEYFLEPVMFRLRKYILIIVIGLFLLISYAINNLQLRRKFM